MGPAEHVRPAKFPPLDLDAGAVSSQPACTVVVATRDRPRLLDRCLEGETPRLLDRPFGPESGRLELRRSTFRRDGKPHHLLVFADLTRSLREEEQQAWQRIVRVLSHEINNSLTPIKSIAHSIKRMISRVPDVPRAAEIQEGLTLIETRSGALGRFLRAYAQLARLPKPQMKAVQIAPIAHRIAELENRLAVTVKSTTASSDPSRRPSLAEARISKLRSVAWSSSRCCSAW